MEKGKLLCETALSQIGKVIVGKEETVRLLLTALLADGHVLLEDVPGTGKTKLAKALAKTVNLKFSRVQFTPDLLPGDITGMNIFDRRENEFVLRRGPVFTNILLADEINRATPRTQAGLLECMEERQVTIDGESHVPGNPFFVIATQNPVETAGTFPLPEAQLDRFTMKLSMGLPSRQEEISILERYAREDPLTRLSPSLPPETLAAAKEEAGAVFVHRCILEYIVDIVSATRAGEQILAGVSPRGTLALLKCAKAYACLQGRGHVIPDDVRALAVPVLSHRIVLGYGAGGTETARGFVRQIVESTTVPTEDFSL